MLRLDSAVIEFPCPSCGFYNAIFFKQARLRDVVICRGCKGNIQLNDQMNECRKVERLVKRTVNEFQRAFANLNREINL